MPIHQPKWQKARVLPHRREGKIQSEPFLHLVGKFVWVKNAPPEIVEGQDFDGQYLRPLSTYLLNLKGWSGRLARASTRRIESFAEFTDHVELIPFPTWSDPQWTGELPPQE